MITLQRGQKSKLSDLGVNDAFVLDVHIDGGGQEIDVACFGLDNADKLSDDRYMIFYNQISAPDNSVTVAVTSAKTTFTVDLSRLNSTIQKLVITASMSSSGTMKNINHSLVTIGNAQLPFSGNDFENEKAIIIAEIYKRDNVWRFGAVGQGFNGGLSALLKHFGGEEVAPEPAVSPAPVQTPAPAAAPSSSINLQKVSGKVQLSKNSKPVLIQKTPEITASISWASGTDYDVYALVYTKDGKQFDVATFGAKGVPALQNYDNGAVVHMGDTGRSGDKIKTEIIKIKLNDNIKAVVPVAYSAQSNGTGSFNKYQVSMLIDNNAGTAVTVSAENANTNDSIYTCVPGLILNTPDGIIIEPLELYSRPSSEHRPKLELDHKGAVKVVMDKGPVNDYK
jgi:tellurite resistance protein TerA